MILDPRSQSDYMYLLSIVKLIPMQKCTFSSKYEIYIYKSTVSLKQVAFI